LRGQKSGCEREDEPRRFAHKGNYLARRCGDTIWR
jgi:hypothetical protein